MASDAAINDYSWNPNFGHNQGANVWPQPFVYWFDSSLTAYPARLEPQQTAGWQCPGCSRGYSPAVRQCGFCGPATAEAPQPKSCGPGREGGMCTCDEPDD